MISNYLDNYKIDLYNPELHYNILKYTLIKNLLPCKVEDLENMKIDDRIRYLDECMKQYDPDNYRYLNPIQKEDLNVIFWLYFNNTKGRQYFWDKYNIGIRRVVNDDFEMEANPLYGENMLNYEESPEDNMTFEDNPLYN